MTLDEHIKKAEEDAVQAEFDSDWGFGNYFIDRTEALEYAENCRQLAEWLKELKQLRERTRWIPVSERLPRVCRKLYDNDFCNYEASDRVLITVNAQNNIFLDIATYTNKGWIGSNRYGLNTVVAWMPLPEPYREEEE